MRTFQWSETVSSGPLGLFTLGEVSADVPSQPLSPERSERPATRQAVAARSLPDTSRTDALSRLLEDARWSAHLGCDIALQPVDALDPILSEDPQSPRLPLYTKDTVPLALLATREATTACLLERAAAIARTVARLHARGFVHAALCPQTIWCQDSGERALLTALDLSFTDCGDLRPQPWRSRRVDLRYLAPELWGSSMDVDRRADLYALGVVFFEMFTGRLPFADLDSVALRHAHSAIIPPRMSSLRDGLDPALVHIVASLLSKDPADRYGSAWGLAHDLAILSRPTIPNRTPVLGGRQARDIPHRPEQLVGRDKELEAIGGLLAVRDRAAIGLVHAPSGLGKTALVKQALRTYAGDRIVAWGMSDQSQMAEPMSTLATPLEAMLAAMSEQPEDVRARFRRGLEDGLGGTIGALADLLPSLSSWVDLDPEPAAALSDRAGQSRLHLGLLGLLQALAASGARPVLVFDDLQWADPATLTTLTWLAESGVFPPLTLLGLYRDDEIVAESSAGRAQAALATNAATTLDLRTGPLDRESVAALMLASLGEEPGNVDALTTSLYEHSRGNPLFAVEEVQELWRSGALRRDGDSGQWTWDEQALMSVPYSSELTSLMEARFRHLDASVREALAGAACFGRVIEPAALARVLEIPEDELVRRMAPALRDGLIVAAVDPATPLDPSPASNVAMGMQRGVPSRMEFRHDQVQAAAYALLPEERKRSLHRAIASLLLGTNPDDDSRIAEAIGHLNVAAPLLVTEGRSPWLAERNLAAARKAIANAAYGEAWTYLHTGISLADASWWQERYDLMRDLHLEGARAACMAGAGPAAVELARTAAERSSNLMDRAMAAEVRIEACKVVDRFDEAIDVGIDALAALGVPLASRPPLGAAIARLLAVHARVLRRGPRTLATFSRMRDPKACTAMRILAQLGAIAFLLRPGLFLASVVAQLRLTLRYGNAPESAYATALYGIVLSGPLQQLAHARQVGEAVEILVERCDAAERPRALMPLWLYVFPWHRPLARSLPVFQRQCRQAFAVGDPEFANYHACGYAAYGVHSGSTIPEALAELEWMRVHVGIIGHHRQYAADIYHQFLANLAREDGDPLQLAGPIYDEASEDLAHAPEMEGHVALVRLMTAVLFDRPEGYRHSIDRFRNVARLYSGMYVLAAFLFWEAVGGLRFEPGPRSQARARWAEARLALWQRFCPDNFAHKRTLLEAERARSRARWSHAQRCYEKAASRALAGGFALEAGLALEGAQLAASQRGLPAEAAHYHERALAVFADHGARAKVRNLRIGGQARVSTGSAKADGAAERGGEGWGIAPESVDLVGVLDASQALSEGMDLKATIDRILRTVVSVAGAERGMVLERRRDGYVLLARGDTREGVIDVEVHSDGIALPADVPQRLLDDVLASKRPVILTDTGRDPRMTARVQGRIAPRSVLCCPLRRGDRDAGIVYLEHRFRGDAFGAREAETVRMLSTQAAISLDNARLYDRQVRLSRGAQRFVPEEFLRLLGKGEVDEVALNDHVEAEMTILVCDIRGFTTTTERMTPEQSFAWINRFFGLAGPVVREQGGFVMKYMGDGFMGVFPEHADDAARTATALLAASRQIPDLSIGIGLHTGPVSVGAVGEHNRIQGDVMSDVANVATRLESLTRNHQVDVVLSEATRKALSPRWREATRSLGRVTVKGRIGELDIHSLNTPGTDESADGGA